MTYINILIGVYLFSMIICLSFFVFCRFSSCVEYDDDAQYNACLISSTMPIVNTLLAMWVIISVTVKFIQTYKK